MEVRKTIFPKFFLDVVPAEVQALHETLQAFIQGKFPGFTLILRETFGISTTDPYLWTLESSDYIEQVLHFRYEEEIPHPDGTGDCPGIIFQGLDKTSRLMSWVEVDLMACLKRYYGGTAVGAGLDLDRYAQNYVTTYRGYVEWLSGEALAHSPGHQVAINETCAELCRTYPRLVPLIDPSVPPSTPPPLHPVWRNYQDGKSLGTPGPNGGSTAFDQELCTTSGKALARLTVEVLEERQWRMTIEIYDAHYRHSIDATLISPQQVELTQSKLAGLVAAQS